jgi:hypothetical protein
MVQVAETCHRTEDSIMVDEEEEAHGSLERRLLPVGVVVARDTCAQDAVFGLIILVRTMRL